ncbi:MAG: hypothetical protein ACHQII_02320, partial [Bacteroidia bacterium]
MQKLLFLILLISSKQVNAQVVSTLTTSTSFINPFGITSDTSGYLYMADYWQIKKINSSTGSISILAGSTSVGSSNGTGTGASFNQVEGITYDSLGNLYVADHYNNMIRKIVIASGLVTTVAGSTTAGLVNGVGTAAQFNGPIGVACDGKGNLFVTDGYNNIIRKIVLSTGVVSTLAGSSGAGSVNGTGTAAQFNTPDGIACDGNGNLYVTEIFNHQIRKIEISSGVVTTLAGSLSNDASIDGTGTSAGFINPFGICYDGKGSLYVADDSSNQVRKIDASTGNVTTIAGSTTSGNVNGTGTMARFKRPYAITSDIQGNLYVTDNGNHEVRKIINLPTSIENIYLNKNGIKLYPNP